MSEWREVAISDLVEKICVGFVGLCQKHYCDKENGVPMIRTTNLTEKGISLDDVKYISHEFHYKNKKSQLIKGDILVARHGDNGKACMYNQEIEANCLNAVIIRPDSIKVIPKFFLYQFNSPQVRNTIGSMSSGSVQDVINTKQISKLKLLIPEIQEQKTIAAVLSSLDNKIDLLHRQNKTLEAMAETLFKQWFVIEAREDWEIVKIGDFVTTNAETVNNSYDQQFIEYLDTSSLTEGKINGIQLLSLKEAPSRARRLVKHNDVLISTVRPNQKHFGIIKNPKNNLVVSTGFCVLTCHKIDPYFIYILLTTDEMTEYLHSIAEGSTSTYPSLKPSDIEKIEFQLPPKNKLDEFAKIASDNWNKIEVNHNQIQTLETLRDNLLPKLMSGDVRVKYND